MGPTEPGHGACRHADTPNLRCGCCDWSCSFVFAEIIRVVVLASFAFRAGTAIICYFAAPGEAPFAPAGSGPMQKLHLSKSAQSPDPTFGTEKFQASLTLQLGS